jgi:protein involved in polysaccharide export with SLBB domain
MRLLDLISAAGGITETGNSTRVSLLRQHEGGGTQVLTVNVKRILQGKAGPEDNPYLQKGDTVIVHGNLFKKVSKISSLMGIGSFVAFLANGRQ